MAQTFNYRGLMKNRPRTKKQKAAKPLCYAEAKAILRRKK